MGMDLWGQRRSAPTRQSGDLRKARLIPIPDADFGFGTVGTVVSTRPTTYIPKSFVFVRAPSGKYWWSKSRPRDYVSVGALATLRENLRPQNRDQKSDNDVIIAWTVIKVGNHLPTSPRAET